MYIHIYVCIYAHTHTHIHSHTHMHTLLFINLYPYAYIMIWERDLIVLWAALCDIHTICTPRRHVTHKLVTSHTNAASAHQQYCTIPTQLAAPGKHTEIITQPKPQPRTNTIDMCERHTLCCVYSAHVCLLTVGVCVCHAWHTNTHSQQTFSTTP